MQLKCLTVRRKFDPVQRDGHRRGHVRVCRWQRARTEKLGGKVYSQTNSNEQRRERRVTTFDVANVVPNVVRIFFYLSIYEWYWKKIKTSVSQFLGVNYDIKAVSLKLFNDLTKQ